MSFNTLQSEQVDVFSFVDSAEADALFASSTGEIALEPLMEVDLGSATANVVPPQGDNVPTAAFRSSEAVVMAAFQSRLKKI